MLLSLTKFMVSEESGSALIEIALVAPVIMLILLGVIEVGRFSNYNVLVASAAKSGVEYGSRTVVNSVDVLGIKSAAVTDSSLANLNVTTSSFCQCADGSTSSCLPTDCGSTHFNQHLTVTASYPFKPVFNVGVGTTIISKSVTMTVRP